ncbi:hypothetical protein UA44_17340 [Klebsiella aerogenes]|nr:hypothetical protein UA44_17340 [Klebsiella aerogenes]
MKAIPSMDKSKLSDNTLQLAIISRIKLYYRPAKLALPPDQAAEKLSFSRSGSSLTLTNPTPYYLTVTELTPAPGCWKTRWCRQWVKPPSSCRRMPVATLLIARLMITAR